MPFEVGQLQLVGAGDRVAEPTEDLTDQRSYRSDHAIPEEDAIPPTFTDGLIEASIVTINRPIVRTPENGPGIKRTATITIRKDDPASMAVMVTGQKPFPLT